MTAILLKSDNSKTTIKSVGEKFTLEELQKYVGGFIEILPSNDPNFHLIVNEEGKMLSLPYNNNATVHYLYQAYDFIVGDAILISSLYNL